MILQKRPEILSQEIRIFFTKYNDPPYVKLEKLEIIVKLCSQSNIDDVLSELKEFLSFYYRYAKEVDVDFVRKSIRAIGKCAIKINQSSDKCVQVLMDLLASKVNYVVQEIIIVMKDIFRKYPSKYDSVIPALCSNVDILDEFNSKAALIWIIGEYADRIENTGDLLQHFIENFNYENPQVFLNFY